MGPLEWEGKIERAGEAQKPNWEMGWREGLVIGFPELGFCLPLLAIPGSAGCKTDQTGRALLRLIT